MIALYEVWTYMRWKYISPKTLTHTCALNQESFPTFFMRQTIEWSEATLSVCQNCFSDQFSFFVALFHFMYNHLPLPLLVLLCWESVGRVLVSSGTGLSSSIRRHTCPTDSFGQGYILSSRLYSAILCHDYILLRRWIHLTLIVCKIRVGVRRGVCNQNQVHF